MDDPEVRREAPAAVRSLHQETAHLRDLLRACREGGAEMRDQLLVHEAPPPLPPAEIENPLAAAPSPVEAPFAPHRAPAWKVRVPRY